MTGPLGVCVCVSGWLHPSPAKYLQSRHVSGAAVFQQIIQSLARQGRAVGRVYSDQRNLHCENKLLYTVTPVSERTLPTFLLMA